MASVKSDAFSRCVVSHVCVQTHWCATVETVDVLLKISRFTTVPRISSPRLFIADTALEISSSLWLHYIVVMYTTCLPHLRQCSLFCVITRIDYTASKLSSCTLQGSFSQFRLNQVDSNPLRGNRKRKRLQSGMCFQDRWPRVQGCTKLFNY